MLVNGDSTLIISPLGKTILIDGGEPEKNILIPYLLARKIKKIDYMIISHFDSDHVGGLLEVMQCLKVKNAVISRQYENSENYQEFKNLVKKKKINESQIQILAPMYKGENGIDNLNILLG